MIIRRLSLAPSRVLAPAGLLAAAAITAAPSPARADAIGSDFAPPALPSDDVDSPTPSVGPADRASDEKTGTQKSAEPDLWWTGSLLAASGRSVPMGHVFFQPYLTMAHVYGGFTEPTSMQMYKSGDRATSVGTSLILFVGLFDRVDIGFTGNGMYQARGGQNSVGIGDTRAQLDVQVLSGDHSAWKPDVVLTAKETFPTGRYKDLRRELLSTDARGGGAYSTTFQANAQKVVRTETAHPLRLRINVAYTQPTSGVSVSNYNAYGGGEGTAGTVHPGATIATTLGAELHLSTHWAVALDVIHSHSERTRFVAASAIDSDPHPAPCGRAPSEHVSVAPAVEYNFNGNIGLVAGLWALVVGRNESAFVSPMTALNTYF